MLKTQWPTALGRLPRQWGWWAGGAALALILGLSMLYTPSSPTLANLPAADQPSTPSLITDASLFLSVLLKLSAVIALIYGSLFLLKRWQGGALVTARRKQLTIVETTRLSPRQALHLVKAGDRTLLIGATDQSLTLLTELDSFAGTLDTALQETSREA